MLFFFQAEDGIGDADVTGVEPCALPILGMDPLVWTMVARAARLPSPPSSTPTDPSPAMRAHACWCARMAQSLAPSEIGRGGCRERVKISVVAVLLKKKNKKIGKIATSIR